MAAAVFRRGILEMNVQQRDKKKGQKIVVEPPLIELEGRLGQISSTGKFTSGVNAAFFIVLLNRMHLGRHWIEVTDWNESEDTYFETLSGKQVRQTRLFDTDNVEIKLGLVVCKDVLHVTTQAFDVADHDAAQQVTDPAAAAIDVNRPVISADVNALRISCAKEAQVEDADVPHVVTNPTHVRIKQRKSFYSASKGLDGARWRYDMTRTWSGGNREEAIASQRSEPARCEIEIEWIPPPRRHGDWHSQAAVECLAEALSKSLIAKLHGLLL